MQGTVRADCAYAWLPARGLPSGLERTWMVSGRPAPVPRSQTYTGAPFSGLTSGKRIELLGQDRARRAEDRRLLHTPSGAMGYSLDLIGAYSDSIMTGILSLGSGTQDAALPADEQAELALRIGLVSAGVGRVSVKRLLGRSGLRPGEKGVTHRGGHAASGTLVLHLAFEPNAGRQGKVEGRHLGVLVGGKRSEHRQIGLAVGR